MDMEDSGHVRIASVETDPILYYSRHRYDGLSIHSTMQSNAVNCPNEKLATPEGTSDYVHT